MCLANTAAPIAQGIRLFTSPVVPYTRMLLRSKLRELQIMRSYTALADPAPTVADLSSAALLLTVGAVVVAWNLMSWELC